MVYTSNKRGSFVIKKSFKGIGQIRRASGTKDEKTFIEIQRMMEKLYYTANHTILEEIRDGVVNGIEVYRYFIEGRLDHLPSTASLRPVIPTVPDWIDTHSVAPKTKTDYKNQIKRFCDVVGTALSIQDIPKAVKTYRRYCDEREIARTFNLCRATILAYLNNNFGKTHTLYRQVVEVKTLKVKSKKQAPKLSVVEFVALTDALPEEYANIARAMVLSGMRPNEVFGEWWLEKDRVVIKGTKTDRSDRIVPLVQPIFQPTRGILAFRKRLKKFREDITPYSFRHSYLHWMELAKISRSRRTAYMGHTSLKDTTEIYEQHEVQEFLQEDAEILRNWILGQLVDEATKEFWGDRLVEDEPDRTALL